MFTLSQSKIKGKLLLDKKNKKNPNKNKNDVRMVTKTITINNKLP